MGWLSDAWDDVKDFGEGVIDGIGDVFTDATDTVVDLTRDYVVSPIVYPTKLLLGMADDPYTIWKGPRTGQGVGGASGGAPAVGPGAYEIPALDFSMPGISSANPGALDVQGLRSRRGSLKDLRVRRNLQAYQLSSIRKGASLAGLNLPTS